MRSLNSFKQRARTWLKWLFLPIIVLLFFVSTMQRTNHVLELTRQTCDTLLVRTVSRSYWGSRYDESLEVYDLLSRRWVSHFEWDETTPAGGTQLIRGGTEKLHIDYGGNVTLERGKKRETIATIPLRGRLPSDIEGGFIFKHLNGTLWYFDIESADYWPLEFDSTASDWIRENPDSWRYSIQEGRCLGLQLGPQWQFYLINEGRAEWVSTSLPNSAHQVSADGTWCLILSDDSKTFESSLTRKLVDTKTGDVISTLSHPGVLWWGSVGTRLFGFYGDEQKARRGRGVLEGVRRFDPETGLPIGEKIEVDTTEYQGDVFNHMGTRYYFLNQSGLLSTFDIDRGTVSHEYIGPGQGWWWPLRITGISLAVIWWLAWSLTSRRGERSYQPLSDVLILHAVLLVCFGVRLYAYMHGPYWSGTLHQWESVGFLGTASSAIGLAMLWVVHGPQRLGIRLGAVAFSLTLLAGFALAVSEADPLKFDPSMARTKTLVGTAASGIALLAVLWTLKAFGIRLCHRKDLDLDLKDSERGFSIQHMIGWTVAFALLFVVLRLRDFQLPDLDATRQLLTSGSVGGLATGVLLWLGLGRSKWRYLVLVLGLGLAGAVYWAAERQDVMQVSAALVPLTLVSTFAFRWNGYCLRRPSAESATGGATG
ncbi:MAG: hypothetical protein AAFX06_02640 [Planctomycetota bacterium]